MTLSESARSRARIVVQLAYMSLRIEPILANPLSNRVTAVVIPFGTQDSKGLNCKADTAHCTFPRDFLTGISTP
jgi:hypothetical protein